MYHSSKTGLPSLREMTNNHIVGRAMSKMDQSSLTYPIMVGGFLGPRAVDVDIPSQTVTDQLMSGPLASVWGLSNGLR